MDPSVTLERCPEGGWLNQLGREYRFCKVCFCGQAMTSETVHCTWLTPGPAVATVQTKLACVHKPSNKTCKNKQEPILESSHPLTDKPPFYTKPRTWRQLSTTNPSHVWRRCCGCLARPSSTIPNDATLTARATLCSRAALSAASVSSNCP